MRFAALSTSYGFTGAGMVAIAQARTRQK